MKREEVLEEEADLFEFILNSSNLSSVASSSSSEDLEEA